MERRQSRCRRRAEVARTFVAFAKMGQFARNLSRARSQPYVRGIVATHSGRGLQPNVPRKLSCIVMPLL